MNTKYDKIADALYIKFNKGKVFKTLKIEDKVIVDLDNNSNVLGIELLNVKAQLKIKSKSEVSKRVNSLVFA